MFISKVNRCWDYFTPYNFGNYEWRLGEKVDAIFEEY